MCNSISPLCRKCELSLVGIPLHHLDLIWTKAKADQLLLNIFELLHSLSKYAGLILAHEIYQQKAINGNLTNIKGNL